MWQDLSSIHLGMQQDYSYGLWLVVTSLTQDLSPRQSLWCVPTTAQWLGYSERPARPSPDPEEVGHDFRGMRVKLSRAIGDVLFC